jgi:hypothetical protein
MSPASSADSHSSTASVPHGLFVEAMGAINMGNDTTHSLLDAMMDRMDRLEAQLNRADRRAAVALEPNVPIDPTYVNYRLMDNQAKIQKLLPMMNDDMLYEFEQCLVDSAVEACDKETNDKVRL